MKELKDMTLKGIINYHKIPTARPRKNMILVKDLKKWTAAKALFYTKTGSPEIADAYQRDFNLTDRMVYGRIDDRIDKLVKKHGWFGRK